MLMIVKRFQGRVVKRMRRVSGGILLTFLSNVRGERGEQITITQSQWDAHGFLSYEKGISRAQLRQMQPAD